MLEVQQQGVHLLMVLLARTRADTEPHRFTQHQTWICVESWPWMQHGRLMNQANDLWAVKHCSMANSTIIESTGSKIIQLVVGPQASWTEGLDCIWNSFFSFWKSTNETTTQMSGISNRSVLIIMGWPQNCWRPFCGKVWKLTNFCSSDLHKKFTRMQPVHVYNQKSMFPWPLT